MQTPHWCTVKGPATWGSGWEFAETPQEAAQKATTSHLRYHPGTKVERVDIQRYTAGWGVYYEGSCDYFTVRNGTITYSTDKQVPVEVAP